MSDVPQARLELDPYVITRTIDAAVITSVEVVNFHFDALAKADLSRPASLPPDAGISFRFGGASLNAEQRRTVHENWILAKAFQELLRSVRQGLEFAHVITELINTKHTAASDRTVAEFLKPFEVKAQDRRFSDLLSDVNKRLATTLDFADSYTSLQAARNCLEHRAGIVGERDTRGENMFLISVPCIKIFYLCGGVEIELAKGDVVEPGDGKDHADILMKIETRKRTFKLGQRLTFTIGEFNQIAFACHWLGAQIVGKLPKTVDIA
jgi:hypothetical protein